MGSDTGPCPGRVFILGQGGDTPIERFAGNGGRFFGELGIENGETTEDGLFTMERVNCLGCCALAPVVEIDGNVHASVTVGKLPSILAQYGYERDRIKV